MSVYVDELKNIVPLDAKTRRVSTRWCHLFSDDVDELHEFARSIGMKRAWFQISNAGVPHYDLTASRRQEAIHQGAVMITAKNYMRMRARRERSRS